MTIENKPSDNEQGNEKSIPGPVRETVSPSGIDLRPEPEKSSRVSNPVCFGESQGIFNGPSLARTFATL